MKILHNLSLLGLALVLLCSCNGGMWQQMADKSPVDYVNPYMGNISHLLVPTYPTVHLPNSMLRVYPQRSDYTAELLNGLPVVLTGHRGLSAFNLSPCQDGELSPVLSYTYDNEHLTPYCYDVNIVPVNSDASMKVEFAVSHQSAIYRINFEENLPSYILLNTLQGSIHVGDNFISAAQKLSDNTNVYLYIEPQEEPVQHGILQNGTVNDGVDYAEGENVCAVWRFADGTGSVSLRYAISFISEQQAKENLHRELGDFDIKALAERGRDIWNSALGSIQVSGGTPDEKSVFYTSLYRVLERPICMSEDGKYFSAFDAQVHEDNGVPFYNDDWIWDTYRAAHPLRVLIDQKKEENIIASYLRMAEQMGNMWMPTFPGVTGDARLMNSNHAVATVADAMVKGLKIDTLKAYEACRRGIEEKTLAPWSAGPAGWIDNFYRTHGYIPALRDNERENDPNVHSFEKRQPIAVTLGTSYDQWCLSRIAQALGKEDEAQYYLKCSYNYRNVYNSATGFFHPKDKNGEWIQPFDYSFSGGMGAREYYDENNGWVYRWDVPHNIADLVSLMGGADEFVKNLDQTFSEPLGRNKYEFYAKLPDHTGNVGQFSMANEPSLHVPYLYNYAHQPWKTQKRIRQLVKMWFRNDLMGVPGDEDGGGMSSFVVFSMLGFYPVTPGIAAYNIGSPIFTDAKMTLSNGKVFEIEAKNVSEDNKYVQSATLNGQEWNKPWFSHDDIKDGGKLVLVMGDKPNKNWGADENAVPPSAESIER